MVDSAGIIYLWEDSYEVRSYDVDFNGVAKCESLCQFMQESAWHHAEHLGVGYAQLVGKGLMWVLSRLSVTLARAPRWGETVRLRTWMSGRDRLFCYRDFRFVDQDECVLGAATTVWFAVDQRSRRPQRTDSYLSVEPQTNERAGEGRAPAIPAVQVRDHERPCRVGYGDLDTNGHVSNATYVGWLLDGLPLAHHQAAVLRSLEIEYLAEAFGDEALSVVCEEVTDSALLHAVIREGEGVALCRARTSWLSASAGT